MHFTCQCGNEIYDITDELPYKGKILADQDMNALWDIINKLEKPHETKINVSGEVSDLFMRNMYQCPDCGRVYIENQSNKYEFVGFNIESPEQQMQDGNKKLFMSAYGEKWKGALYADWYDEKPSWMEYHGSIMPCVNIKLENLHFDNYDLFEKRFFEVLEYLKELDIVVSASMRVNGKQTYNWPDKGEGRLSKTKKG